MITTALSTRPPGNQHQRRKLQQLPPNCGFKPLEFTEVLDLLVNEQYPHLTSCPKNRFFRTFGEGNGK